MYWDEYDEISVNRKMEEICEHAGIIQGNPDIICMAYSRCKRADGKVWAHYPICSNENCPIKHPELLEEVILKTDHTMSYKEAARRIKEHMRVHDQKEPYTSHPYINEALSLAIEVLAEKAGCTVDDIYDTPEFVPKSISEIKREIELG